MPGSRGDQGSPGVGGTRTTLRAGPRPPKRSGIASAPESRTVDPDGNPILIGSCSDGQPLEIVVALDDPEFVITVIPRRKRR